MQLKRLSRIQGATVFDIFEEIFADYQGQGKLVPSWRFALADASQYPRHEACIQFEESDWSFVERLLADEGLFYWFEHHADHGSDAAGMHQLVIGDHNGAFTPNSNRRSASIAPPSPNKPTASPAGMRRAACCSRQG